MIDLLLENKLILISIAMSVVPLVLTILLVLIIAISNMFAVRQQRKLEEERRKKIRAKKARARQLAMAAAAADDDEIAEVSLAGIPMNKEASKSEQTEEDKEENKEEPETDSAIQDILTSVFVDEEANERYQILLQDKTPVSAEELDELADDVAAQLRDLYGGIAS